MFNGLMLHSSVFIFNKLKTAVSNYALASDSIRVIHDQYFIHRIKQQEKNICKNQFSFKFSQNKLTLGTS